jgi:hypothetical protein
MDRHRKALAGAKPLVDTRGKQRPVSSKSCHNKAQFFQEFGPVLKMFQALSSQKAMIDNKPPKTASLALPRPPKKREQFEKAQHKLNLQSTTKKIGEGLRWVDRKKNASDPVANPVYFIKKAEDFPGVAIDPLLQHLLTRPSSSTPFYSTPDPSKPPIAHRRPPKPKAGPRKATNAAAVHLAQQALQAHHSYQEFLPLRETEVPRVNGSGEGHLTELKAQLAHHIYSNKVYKEIELRTLELRTCLHNPQVDEKRVAAIFEEIRAEM